VALLRLPYIRIYRDRHGRVRRYFRRRGRPDTPLPGDIGSDEFMRAYQTALGEPAKRPRPHAAGTLAKLIEDYYASVEFANLKPTSRATYRLILDPSPSATDTAWSAICPGTRFAKSCRK
jgi:hypothetical protein